MEIAKEYIEPVPKRHHTQIDEEFTSGIGKIKERVIILLDIQKILETNLDSVS
jgi:chemotaxis signal transduction protein